MMAFKDYLERQDKQDRLRHRNHVKLVPKVTILFQAVRAVLKVARLRHRSAHKQYENGRFAGNKLRYLDDLIQHLEDARDSAKGYVQEVLREDKDYEKHPRNKHRD